MKRRAILLLLLFLVGGAIVNVAVAWASGHRARLPSGQAANALSMDEASALWQIYGSGSAPRVSPPKGWRERRAFTDTIWVGTSLMSADTGQFVGFAVAPTVNDVLIVESGVPLRSLRHMASDVVSTMPTMPAPPGQAPPVSHTIEWLRQTRPIWPGFAINTVFYAGVLWLLFAGPFVLRRWRRIRRGLCPKCAYDLRGSESESCPECGAAVNRIAR